MGKAPHFSPTFILKIRILTKCLFLILYIFWIFFLEMTRNPTKFQQKQKLKKRRIFTPNENNLLCQGHEVKSLEKRAHLKHFQFEVDYLNFTQIDVVKKFVASVSNSYYVPSMCSVNERENVILRRSKGRWKVQNL